MAGFDIDTSSYPKPSSAPPPNPLDTLGRVIAIQQGQQGLESGQLGIDKQKLDLINQRFGGMVKDFTALATDPNLNEDKIRQRIQTDVKLGIVTPDMAGTFITQLPPTQGMKPQEASALLKGHLETWLNHAQTIKEAIDTHYGSPSTVDTGNAIQPVSVSPINGIRSTGLPIAKQVPTGTPGFDQNGRPSFAPANPDAVAMPPAAPGVRLPVARPAVAPAARVSGPTGPTVERTDLEPTSFADRFAPAPPPLFEEGKKAYTEDQANATARATAMKPAEQALKLLPGLRSGPGTEPFNKAVAFLKANNIISTDTGNDPTAIYQEVNKKLAQYVASSPAGQRSDAAQTLAEAASPSPKTQINQALIKLTRDALALDRVQIARPNAFEGNNYQDYGKHRSTFPQSIDERAFGMMDLPEADRQKLVQTMLNKYKKNPNDAEAKRFLKSYDLAKKQGFLSNSEDQ